MGNYALQDLRKGIEIGEEKFFRLFTCGAVNHLYSVSSAIDSQILGDMQILGQIKEAYEVAQEAGSVGNVFNHLFMGAFHTGKRVRNETAIGIGAVSISFAAVELARKIFSDLHKKRVLLIGTGETGILAARHLMDKGVTDMTLTNRTYENAVAAADELNAKAVPFESLEEAISNADIVVSATAAPHTVVTKEMVKKAMKARQNRTLLMIDIALPRDIDPEVGSISNVFLKDIDSLQNIIDRNYENRAQEIPKAKMIVTEEVVNFFMWYNTLAATPTIQQLRGKFENIRQQELEKFRNKIQSTDFETIEILTHRIMNKFLHPTMVGLKEPVYDDREMETRIQVLKDLFDLDEDGTQSNQPEE